MPRKKKNGCFLGIRIPEHLDIKLDKTALDFGYFEKSAFARFLIEDGINKYSRNKRRNK